MTIVVGNLVSQYTLYGAAGAAVQSTFDEDYANVSSLIRFDGADAATAITDATRKAWTFNGNAQLDTAQFKFGQSSLLLDGTGDYLSTPDHDDFEFGNGEFTVEGWVRVTGADSSFVLAAKYVQGGGGASWLCGVRSNAILFIIARAANGTNNLLYQPSWNPADDQWYHMAFVRDNVNNLMRVFIDGVELGAGQAVTGADSCATGTADVTIGAYTESPFDYLNGWIDNVRITKGVCRYRDDFTPPDRPFGLVAGLVAWYDPSNSVAYALDTGRVTDLYDLSGLGNDLQETGGTSGPPQGAGINSLSTLAPAASDVLQRANANLLGLSGPDLTVLSVFEHDFTGANFQGLIGMTNSGWTSGWRIAMNSGIDNLDGSVNTYTTNPVDTSGGDTSGLGALAGMSWGETANELTGYYNGVQTEQNTSYTSAVAWTNNLELGFVVGGASFAGQIGETMLFDRVVPTIDRQRVEGYLALKWGFAHTLSVSHPWFAIDADLIVNWVGTDAQTSYTSDDDNARTATFAQNAQLDDAIGTPFGAGTALLFDGTNDIVHFPDAANWDFGSSDFTVECWVRFNGAPGANMTFISHYNASTTNRSWLIGYRNSDDTIRFITSPNGSSTTTHVATWAPAGDTWYHVAACREGNNLRLFVDGVLLGTSDVTGLTLHANTEELRFGGQDSNTTPNDDFNGWIGPARILNGTALYTANFTPPVQNFINP